jgi:diphthine synthase
MTFYLIGLGLNEQSMTIEALEALKKCKKIFLEKYTSDFPYNKNQIEKIIKKKNIKKKIQELGREGVESEEIVNLSKGQNTALLVYGNPLSATTHIQLILACKKQKIPYKIIHAESILSAISETGLQPYKFGKTASMPRWVDEKYKPDSWCDIILQNQKIKSHTLILIDVGLTAEEAVEQLGQVCKKRNIKLSKIIICSQIGTKKSKIYYGSPNVLKKKKVQLPFCIIIPSKMHFLEKKALEIIVKK